MGSCTVLRRLAFTLFLSLFTHASSAYKITGATAGVDPNTGERPFRYEINDFKNHGAAWDIFVLALSRFQSDTQSDLTSYFQVAGIHGYPSTDWDNVHGNGANSPGYCHHASVAFPTWHRPYLALFEQKIVEHAQTIAQMYPDDKRQQYLDVAPLVRIPYWDWAVNPALPDVTTSDTLSINTPEGLMDIRNPLLQYNFQSNAAGNGFPTNHPATNFPNTVRHYDQSTGKSNQAAASAAMQASAPNVLSLVYQLFSTNPDFSAFSCTNPGGNGNGANNIENIHNGIHNNVGGFPGHMSYPEVAAFDPIFWIHHANVDRYFAMWQALNPNSYIVPTPNTYGTYTDAIGTIDSGSSSLTPFHSDDGDAMYTSDEVRSTRSFGYTYPELVDWGVSPDQLASNVRQKVNELYNPDPQPNSNKKEKRDWDLLDAFSDIVLDVVSALGVNNLDMQWSIKLELDRYAFDSTFEMYFFMGEPPEDINTWSTASNLVGTHSQFIAADVLYSHPEGRPQGLLQGEISLTHTLAAGMDRGVLANLFPDIVLPILTENLQWRARSGDGSELDVNDIAGLQVTVTSRKVQPRTSIFDFPIYDAIVAHPEVTQGRNGTAGYKSRI